MKIKVNKNTQIWECKHCKWRYESPVRVSSVVCPERHRVGRSLARRECVLLEGPEPRLRITKV